MNPRTKEEAAKQLEDSLKEYRTKFTDEERAILKDFLLSETYEVFSKQKDSRGLNITDNFFLWSEDNENHVRRKKGNDLYGTYPSLEAFIQYINSSLEFSQEITYKDINLILYELRLDNLLFSRTVIARANENHLICNLTYKAILKIETFKTYKAEYLEKTAKEESLSQYNKSLRNTNRAFWTSVISWPVSLLISLFISLFAPAIREELFPPNKENKPVVDINISHDKDIEVLVSSPDSINKYSIDKESKTPSKSLDKRKEIIQEVKKSKVLSKPLIK